MDYRSYENKVNEIKNDIFDFLMLRYNKVNDYSNDIIDAYGAMLDKGDISIKSFKLKVLHNEHSCQKNNEELDELLKFKYQDFVSFLDNFFLDYEKNLKQYKFYPTRKAELAQLNYLTKKKKQDNINRINNLDKEINNKTKEFENYLNEKNKNHLANLAEINRRLTIDLQRNIESCEKEYLSLEKSLLDIDEKDKIKEIRAKINEIRSRSLSEQYDIKIKCYESLKNINDACFKEIYEKKNEFIDYQTDNEKKIASLENEIELFKLEENENIFNYDYQKDIESIDVLNNDLMIYQNCVDSIYQKLLNDNKSLNNDYKVLLLNKKIIECTIQYFQVNFYDPAIRMINRIQIFFNDIKESIDEKYAKYNQYRETKYQFLLDKVNNLQDDAFKNKKTNRLELQENIESCINNLFDIKYFEKEFSLLLDFIDMIIAYIDERVVQINNINKYFSNPEVVQNNGKKIIVDEGFNNLVNNIKTFGVNYRFTRDNEKKEFDINNVNLKNDLEHNLLLKYDKIEKNSKNNYRLNKKDNEKDYYNIDKEYLESCKKANDDLKYWKSLL